MTEDDVTRLAAAIAKANGHDDVDTWAASVLAAWKALGATPADPAPTDAAPVVEPASDSQETA